MKKFTDTNKWNDEWFGALSGSLKLGYLYLLDICDGAGVVNAPGELSSRIIGMDVDWAELETLLGRRLIVLKCGKWWLCKHIAFQCPKGLSPTAPTHNKIRQSIVKYELFDLLDGQYYFEGCETSPRPLRDLSKTSPRPLSHLSRTHEDKDKDKEEDTATDTTTTTATDTATDTTTDSSATQASTTDSTNDSPIDSSGRPRLNVTDIELIDQVIAAAGFRSDCLMLSVAARDSFVDRIEVLRNSGKLNSILKNIADWRKETAKKWSMPLTANNIPNNLGSIVDFKATGISMDPDKFKDGF
jgi:hypothetical protein